MFWNHAQKYATTGGAAFLSLDVFPSQPASRSRARGSHSAVLSWRKRVTALLERSFGFGAILLLALGSFTANAGLVVTKVGTPTFKPVDLHQFAAPIGTSASGYAEFQQTLELLLPPPNHLNNPTLGIGPGAAHSGFDHELADGLAANGFLNASQFTTDQYSNGTGVYLAFMLVPDVGAPSGSSPDFASGPIIANADLPMDVFGQTFANGVVNDTNAVFSVPPINTVTGFETLDGHSHIPLFFVDNFDFATSTATGNYEYRITLRDAHKNGYDIAASFALVPEPTTGLMMLSSLVALLACGRRRKRTHSLLTS